MIKQEQHDVSRLVCPECQTGVMRLRYVTYFTWLGQSLVTVPDFPAWICDVCNRREYDRRAIIRLNVLLRPDNRRYKFPKHRLREPRRSQTTP